MPIRWDATGCELVKGNPLFDEYIADKRVTLSILELLALWKYGTTKEDYGKRTILALGQPIHEVTKEDIDRWADQLKFWDLSEQETKEYRDAYRKYALGLVGMQVWAELK